MSRQLVISVVFSVLAMAGFALSQPPVPSYSTPTVTLPGLLAGLLPLREALDARR